MPRPSILKISEVFTSVQGEGLRQGQPTIFVRLAGCNLRCAFCDTKYAWKEGKDREVGDIMAQIEGLRRNFPADWICLTGGEPFLQNIGPLARRLRKAGLPIQIETNGTLYRRIPFDWLTISPKPPRYAVRSEWTRRAREVKLVAGRSLSFDVLRDVRAAFPAATPVLIQPQSCAAWSARKAFRLLEHALAEGLPNIRLSSQLHKIHNLN
ncbi:MAG: 7-carboxy-7-deazaguanine synthase QueE [Acidobacteriota bacterium]|nr:7-carboxy-7-deazaguanine synthase QueE [Acidobacteriota bacterium]